MKMPPLVAAAVALALSACNAPAPQASAPPAPGSVAVTPSNFQMPEGEGCKAEVARNDLSMGHVARSVYNQMRRETDAAEAACAAGHDAQARAMIAASEKRRGYPSL